MTALRYSQQRQFATIESDRLPIVGEANRHRYRAMVWRRILLGLLLFWAGIIAAIVYV